MTDIDESALSQLLKEVRDQARFTRIVSVLCCLSIIGCMFYALTSMISTMPDLVIARMLANVENMHTEWKAIDRISGSTTPVKK